MGNAPWPKKHKTWLVPLLFLNTGKTGFSLFVSFKNIIQLSACDGTIMSIEC